VTVSVSKQSLAEVVPVDPSLGNQCTQHGTQCKKLVKQPKRMLTVTCQQ